MKFWKNLRENCNEILEKFQKNYEKNSGFIFMRITEQIFIEFSRKFRNNLEKIIS